MTSQTGSQAIPRPFPRKFQDPIPRKSKLSISLDQLSKVLHSLFLLYAKLSAVEIY